jgi:hypothetical protein
MSEVKWLVELWRENKPALFLYGDSREEIARNIIEADDYYGEFGTAERMAKCWTPNALMANTYSEADAKQNAAALDRCCGGIAVAVDHLFISDAPYSLNGE